MSLKGSVGFYLKKVSDAVGVEKVAEALDMNKEEVEYVLKNKKLLEEDIKRINELYDKGQSIKSISEEVGFSRETVRKHISKRSDYIKKTRSKPLSDDVIKIIERFSENGHSATYIAAQTGLSVHTVRNHAKSKYKQLTDEEKNLVDMRITEGKSINYIANELNRSRNAIYRYLKTKDLNK